ncbi:hypothetical protein LWI29_010533 [Acer saccharum]|uniref:Uncharacterized protein n=1 Tax=Acer saccharum TaxID=4024 RepID=A0AA39TD69_ACESA|nr:hypothetical protein LWI29_010533 [Acer saccharum]
MQLVSSCCLVREVESDEEATSIAKVSSDREAATIAEVSSEGEVAIVVVFLRRFESRERAKSGERKGGVAIAANVTDAGGGDVVIVFRLQTSFKFQRFVYLKS